MLDSVQRVIVDGGYTGQEFSDQVKLILDANTTVAKRNELHTFKVLHNDGSSNVHGAG